MSPSTRHDQRAGIDPGIAITTGSLITLGVVMSYSSTAALALEATIPPLFFDHLVGLVLGLGAATLAYRIPATALRRSAMPVWVATMLLLTLLLLLLMSILRPCPSTASSRSTSGYSPATSDI